MNLYLYRFYNLMLFALLAISSALSSQPVYAEGLDPIVSASLAHTGLETQNSVQVPLASHTLTPKNSKHSITAHLSTPSTPKTQPKFNQHWPSPLKSTQQHFTHISASSSAAVSPAQQYKFKYGLSPISAAKTQVSKSFYQQSPAQKADQDLLISKDGVPYLSLYKKKRVKKKNGKYRVTRIPLRHLPKINPGREAVIGSEDFNLEFGFPKMELPQPLKLKSPKKFANAEFKKWLKKKPLKTAKTWKQNIKQNKNYIKPVTEKEIAQIDLQMGSESTVTEKTVTPFSKNELLMLSALILNRSGKRCHLVAGLYERIKNDKSHQQLQLEARLNLGICQKNMGLFSDASSNLTHILKQKDSPLRLEAIQALSSGFPADVQGHIALQLRKIKNISSWPQKDKDQLHYMLAKERYFGKKYQQSIQFAKKIKPPSSHYPKAQFIIAVADYNLKRPSQALDRLQKLNLWIKKNNYKHKDLNTLVNLNIARISFIKGHYRTSFQHYMKTNKSHPLWVESMTEMGWAQLALKDYSGAIGNMYSMQSPFFKAVYKPETHAIRTIGYINICQFGDAYRSLSLLEKRYSQWRQSVSTYLKKNKKNSMKYYNTMKSYLSGKSHRTVDQLPYQVIREIGRQKEFINIQKTINRKIDEIEQYQFVSRLIRQDIKRIVATLKNNKTSIRGLRAKIKKTKKDLSLAKTLAPLKASLATAIELRYSLQHQLESYRTGHKSFKKQMKRSVSYMKKEKRGYQKIAGRKLRKHLRSLHRSLGQTLANNEFLRYEIFAGSGENIRFQVAGGKTKKQRRIPAHVKPKKILNWEFEGEFWEDEIGSYRSSLKNNCPKTPSYVTGGIK